MRKKLAENIQRESINKVFLYLALSLFVGFYSCSGDDEPSPSPEAGAPHSVTIDNQNANMPSAGVLTSEYSDSPAGSDVGKLADGSADTKFVTGHSAFYVLWAGNEEAAVNLYSLTSADDSSEKDPKSWTLSGSNDKSTWKAIDNRTGQTFSKRKEKKEYQLQNKTAYKYYKLQIESNNGANATQISGWSIQEVWTDIADLMQYSGGNTHSPLTPMGNHYANRHTTTDADRIWLKTAGNEPLAPAHVSHLYLAGFPVTLYPYGDPKPADVNQHAIGDCGGLAALASMAYIYPGFVKSLIKDNGDKTYTVAMFDPQGSPVEVTVSSRFLTGNGSTLDAVSGKNNRATWSTVLEKAIMKYNHIYEVNPDIGGIGSEHVIPLFTGDGDSFSFSPGALTARQLARVVKVCLTEGKLIIGGFTQGDLPVDGSKTVTAHAYTLMHSTNKSALFSMRNPWGGNPDVDGSKDGVLNIPNNTLIPPTIDLRIVNPGIAGDTGTTDPYIPPVLKAGEARMRVAEYLLRPGIQ